MQQQAASDGVLFASLGSHFGADLKPLQIPHTARAMVIRVLMTDTQSLSVVGENGPPWAVFSVAIATVVISIQAVQINQAALCLFLDAVIWRSSEGWLTSK